MCDHTKLGAFERYLIFFSLQPKHLSCYIKFIDTRQGFS